jgi:hypothetical protein
MVYRIRRSRCHSEGEAASYQRCTESVTIEALSATYTQDGIPRNACIEDLKVIPDLAMELVLEASDDSPWLKPGASTVLHRCCVVPQPLRLVAFNTREVACAAPASRTSTPSKVRCCFYPWERFTTEPANSMQLAECYQTV